MIRCCLRDERLEQAITLMKEWKKSFPEKKTTAFPLEEAIDTDLRPEMETYKAMNISNFARYLAAGTSGNDPGLFFNGSMEMGTEPNWMGVLMSQCLVKKRVLTALLQLK